VDKRAPTGPAESRYALIKVHITCEPRGHWSARVYMKPSAARWQDVGLVAAVSGQGGDDLPRSPEEAAQRAIAVLKDAFPTPS